MTMGKVTFDRTMPATATAASVQIDHPREFAEWFPRPIRFLGIGALGLLTDLGVFTAIIGQIDYPLGVRLVSLAAATVVTWRLNRALTFDRSGRHQGEEAARYVVVTVVSQGVSYAVFASLVLTVSGRLPQAALLVGAAVAAAISYNGHRLFAFAPRRGKPPFHTAPEGTHGS